jgi:predicted ATPase
MAERSHNLPMQPTPLIGREREVRAILDLIMRDEVRLVTLTGPGGTGKTRVGIEVAATLLDEFDDGAFFVDLAPLRDPTLVVPAVAQTLGAHDDGAGTVLDKLVAHLQDKGLLLLLDNFEHVLPAGPALSTLLSACPRLKILATSRAALHLRGEREFPVPPLALPEPRHRSRADNLSTYAAIALFVQRAADVRPDFKIGDQDAPLVVEICRRLDGLPLAIELAAARIKYLTPQAMLLRLERRLPFLIGGARDLPERQQTLRATISWSYDLLSEDERRGLDRLAVFAGGCALEAIEVIWVGDEGSDVSVLDIVASLVDKSLVRRLDERDGTLRFTMLETVREFAAERLAASGEEQIVRRRHAEYYLTFAELARGHLRGPNVRTWLDRFEAEHDNLRIALAWGESTVERAEAVADAVGGVSGIELASRITQACAWFWLLRGHLRQGLGYVERLLASAPSGTPAHARALVVASGLHHYAGDAAAALRRGEEGLAEWRSLGDRSQVALALARVGQAYGLLRQADRATALLEECEALSGDARHEADLEFPIVFALAKVASTAGSLESATKLSNRAPL